MSRAIDHLVLPVESLEVAQRRLASLGFTVAPRGDHPFGTSNACVFLADGIYLEPLAVRDVTLVEESVRAGNVFTGRDAIFRRQQSEGLSAVVLASANAQADHEAFVRSGVSAGDLLEFSREAVSLDGRSVSASFRLAFADAASERFFIFTCERINPLPADRDALMRHANGVTALRAVVIEDGIPATVQPLFESLLEPRPGVDGGERIFVAAEALLRLVDAGGAPQPAFGSSSARATTLVFAVSDLSVTERLLADNQLPYLREPQRIVVAPAPGLGVIFVFEE